MQTTFDSDFDFILLVFLLFIYFFFVLFRFAVQGPPIENERRGLIARREPQPPSIDDIDFAVRAPAPPEGSAPMAPSPPDSTQIELFEKNPTAFAAIYANKQRRDVTNRRYPTYDQFLTAAVVSGIDLRNRVYTMFAPDDRVFNQLNISLPLLALKDKNCVARLVRYAGDDSTII